MTRYYLFGVVLTIAFLYSILNIKNQYKTYKEIKNIQNLNTYKELKILIWEVSSIVIGVLVIMMFLIVSIFDLWHLVKW